MTLFNLLIMGTIGGYLGHNSNWSGIVCVLIAYVWGVILGRLGE